MLLLLSSVDGTTAEDAAAAGHGRRQEAVAMLIQVAGTADSTQRFRSMLTQVAGTADSTQRFWSTLVCKRGLLQKVPSN